MAMLLKKFWRSVDIDIFKYLWMRIDELSGNLGSDTTLHRAWANGTNEDLRCWFVSTRFWRATVQSGIRAKATPVMTHSRRPRSKPVWAFTRNL
jgi:hypothetical protein